MKTIGLIVMVAIVLEALVEYTKTIVNMVEEKEYKTAIIQGVTICLGIFLAFTFRLQLFNQALVEFYDQININPNIDMVLTGILFSRGSNYFSDLITHLTSKNKDDEDLDDFEIDTDEDDELSDMLDNDIVETEDTEGAEG